MSISSLRNQRPLSRTIVRFFTPSLLVILVSSEAGAQKMYWTDSTIQKIQRADLDGSNVEDLVVGTVMRPLAMGVDPREGKLYWIDRGSRTIRRASVDGAESEDVVRMHSLYPHPGYESLALDLVVRKIYWTETFYNEIRRANFDGSEIEQVPIPDLSLPMGIAVDPQGGKIYWSETLSIRKANLDGSEKTTIISRWQTSGPRGIALDVGAGKLYWVDTMINRCNLDGSHAEELVSSGGTTPNRLTNIALDVAAGKMYWTDASEGTLSRANIDGSDVEPLVDAGEDSRVVGVAIDGTEGHVYWSDSRDRRIRRADLDGTDVRDILVCTVYDPMGIALDLPGGKIYWTQGGTPGIRRANLDGSQLEGMTEGFGCCPFGIALDPGAGRMYWTDVEVGMIQRAYLDGTDVELLVRSNGYHEPLWITLSTDEGRMYWSQGGGQIESANGDGSDRYLVLTDAVSQPRSLALDSHTRSLYWTGLGSINRTGLENADTTEILSGWRGGPTGIALDTRTGRMYWTNSGRWNTVDGSIQTANLDGSGVETLLADGLGSPIGIALDLREPPAAYLDIKPGSCPNPFNVRSRGLVQVALAGTELFDVSQVDVETIRRRRADGIGKPVGPREALRGTAYAIEDVTSPSDGDPCNCYDVGGDGIDDLVVKFSTSAIATAFELADTPRGEFITFRIAGSLHDGREFEASDCVVIRGTSRHLNPYGRRP